MAPLTELIAKGALDDYLTKGATMSFWKMRYTKHTSFAMESCTQPFSTPVHFGQEAQVTLNRQGDLIHFMYICIDLPGIVATTDNGSGQGSQFPAAMDRSCAPCAGNDEAVFMGEAGDAGTDTSSEHATKLKAARDQWLKTTYGHASSLENCEEVEDCPDNLLPETGGVWAHYCNGIGQYLVKSVKMIVGGSMVDQILNDFLFCWEELTGKAGRRLTEMIGKRYTRAQLCCDSRQARQLWVPLPFWFTQHSGNALSLASLQFHGVSLHVEFAKLENCIVVSGRDVTVKNATSACCLTPSDLKANLEITYVFLENAERERFATNHFEVLITQHQSFAMQTTTSQPRIQLNFNHPCVELLIACRRQCHERCNNWFNYSGIDNRDPLVSADLLLNNTSRFGVKSGQYLRTVVPYQFHTNIPDAFIYVMSFSLFPEESTPSGSCNFSRIDHCEMQLKLQDGLAREQCTIMIFAISYNVLRFREGLGGLAFAN